jgi:large subunit ribosomal protein L10
MIQTPGTRIAGILQAPGGQIARVLAAYASKDDAGGDTPPAASEAA